MSWLSRIFRRSPVDAPPPSKVGKVQDAPFFQPTSSWTMDMVESALQRHERGDFSESGKLADAILCDEEIASLAGLRTGTVTGLPFHFEPDFPGLQRDWEHMLPYAVQDDVLYRSLLLGVSLLQDKRRTYEELPTWRPWPCENVRWDEYRQVWQVLTRDRGLVDITPGDGHWALFESRFGRPWMSGLIRAVAPMMIIRQSSLFNWANHAQVYATPSRVLTADRRMAELDDVQRAIERLRRLVGDSTIVLPEGLKLELLELKELTYQIYERLRKAIDESLSILFVGQVATTQARGGWGGAHVERRVTQNLLERDVRILQVTCHRQILGPYDAWRRGTTDLARVPRPIWDTTPPADLQALAQRRSQESLARLQEANELKTLAALDFGDGWRVDMLEICRQRGIPVKQQRKTTPAAPLPAEGQDAAA